MSSHEALNLQDISVEDENAQLYLVIGNIVKSKIDRSAVGFVDSENYMLRGISPGPEPRPRSSSLTGYNVNKSQQSDVDFDNMLVLRENVRCLALPAGADVIDVSSTTCARVMSFHSFFCTCNISCCCMCDYLSSPDCDACFHKLCVRFATNVCQKNTEAPPPVTLDNDKVSSYSQS